MIEVGIIARQGALEPLHRRALELACPRIRIVGAAHPDVGVLKCVGAMFDLTGDSLFTDYRDLLSALRLDAVYIAFADAEQEPALIASIRAGLHVITHLPEGAPSPVTPAVAEAIRATIVKVAWLTPGAEDPAREAADGILQFVHYLEEGVGDYPGKDLAPEIEPPEPVQPAFIQPTPCLRSRSTPIPSLAAVVDGDTLDDVLATAREIYAHCDILELGPRILAAQGLGVIEDIKERLSNRLYLAQWTGEANAADQVHALLDKGADIVAGVDPEDDAVIAQIVAVAREQGGMVCVHLSPHADVARRTRRLEALGVHIIGVTLDATGLNHGIHSKNPLIRARQNTTGQVAVTGPFLPDHIHNIVVAGANLILPTPIDKATPPDFVALRRQIHEAVAVIHEGMETD